MYNSLLQRYWRIGNPSEYTEYSRVELQGYEKLFNYIGTDLLQNRRIVRLNELYA